MKNYLTILFCLLMTNAFAQGKFFGGNGDGFAVSESAMILPVQLVSFRAALKHDKAQIEWTAITENITSFTLELSGDGNRFEYLTEKAVLSNAMVPVRYGYADGPRTGLWYYRLQWVEADGSQAFSKVIAVMFSPAAPLQAFYDAGADFLTVKKPAGESFIELYSSDGQLLKTIRNYQAVCTIPVNNLPAGLYIIRLRGQAIVTRFLKLR